MSSLRKRGESVRKFIIEQLDRHPTDIAKVASEHFKISRQAVNKHISRLVTEKAVTKSGSTRNLLYKLQPLVIADKHFFITPSLSEDDVWRKDVRPLLEPMPDNVMDIWHYGFTEMFNNAIDHSDSKDISLRIKKTAASTEVMILDYGIGIFKKIQSRLDLPDERQAVLELAKGKFTTDPANHSGEGIFFASRMFDDFMILSGDVFFSHKRGKKEGAILKSEGLPTSTAVVMKLDNHTSRKMKKIFDQYTSGDDYGFNKTIVPVTLAQYGTDKLISRSQAKRLLAGVDKFKVVAVDFKGVDSIGQAFADEIFRVFPNAHPQIQVMEVNTNTEVKNMILRARALSEATKDK